LTFGQDDDTTSSRNANFDDLNNLLNQTGYNYPKHNPENPYSGSVNDYYKAISHGRMSPNFEIINASENNTPSSLNEYAYNINDTFIDYGETNDSNGTNLKPKLAAAYNRAVNNYGIENFDKLYGKENIVFIHPGYGAEQNGAWAGNEYIWSHDWSFNNNSNKRINYNINPFKIRHSGIPRIISIGNFVYSTLDAFGLSNLYDTDGTSKGAGYLSIMGSGKFGVNSSSPWLPTFATTYVRSKFSGFFTANIIEINNTTANLSLPPISTDDKSYKLTIPGNTNEYWLLDYKTAAGFDRKLPSDGIAIWHIVENVNNNNNEYPSNNRGESGYKMSLEASDGLFNLERKKINGNNGGRSWTPGQEFSPYSTPSTVMENGNSTGIRVYNIRQVGDNMLFDVEYITEPSNEIINIDLNKYEKLLTITTTAGLTNKNLEIGFNNKEYVSFEVTSEEMVIDLKNEPYLTPFNNNIKVNNNSPYNGFNTLNIRADANSFTNNMSERPFNYNYTFEFRDPEPEP
jgi:M6 family metalloprotease-like protein